MPTISLKDATSNRPGTPPRLPNLPTVQEDPITKWQKAMLKLANPMWTDGATSRPMWTPREFNTFERLVNMTCSHIHTERLKGKFWLQNFQRKHGKEKCDMMMAELRRLDEQEWFKDASKRKGS